MQQQLHIDVSVSCAPEQEPFLRCLAAGLKLNIAKRAATAETSNEKTIGSKHMLSNLANDAPNKHELKRMKMEAMASQTLSMNSSGSTVKGSGKYSFSQPAEQSCCSFKPQSFLFLKGAHAQAAGAGTVIDRSAPYRTLRGNQPVHVHPTSVLFSLVQSRKLPEFVVFAELLITSKQYMRHITAIDGSWVTTLQAVQG